MRPAVLALTFISVMVAPAQASVRVGWQDQRAEVLASEAPTAFAAARFMGSREMRLIVLWHKVQPTKNEWHWEEFDAAIDRARANGFTVQLVLGGLGARPPVWAARATSDHGWIGLWRNLDDGAYRRFVTAAARRYGTRVRVWAILNEVDLTGYPAKRYAALYARSRLTIRRFAGPRAILLWGDFSPWAPVRYTKNALRSSKKPVIADGFAVHPYAGPHSGFEGGINSLGRVKRVLGRLSRSKSKRLARPGRQRLPLHATEFGCQTRINSEVQCARQWELALKVAQRHRLRQLVAYQLLPGYHASWDTSLVRPDGSPTQAMRLIAAWVRKNR